MSTPSKQPIEVADIRKGDLIRWEREDKRSAHEWVSDGTLPPYVRTRGTYFLLERPSPRITISVVQLAKLRAASMITAEAMTDFLAAVDEANS